MVLVWVEKEYTEIYDGLLLVCIINGRQSLYFQRILEATFPYKKVNVHGPLAQEYLNYSLPNDKKLESLQT